MTIILYVVIAVICIIILFRPYLGLVFISASIPVTDILPTVPFLSSIFPLFGVFTVISFLFHSQNRIMTGKLHFNRINLLGLLLIGWIFISNSEAAWFSNDSHIIITYIELWILTWLAGELLDTPQKQRILMWVFSFAAILSAFFAIQKGNIGLTVNSSTRSAGLADGINTAARYFIIGLIFLMYLRTQSHNLLNRTIATIGVIVTLLGVAFTVSRTAMILLPAVFGLMIFLQPGIKYRAEALIGAVFLILVLLFFSDNIINIAKSIMPSISQGTDTIGIRYALWKAGWRMWLDNPIAGVGIGMYPSQLIHYGQDIVPTRLLETVPHNMYIAMLAETGLIGFLLFISLLVTSLRNIWLGGNLNDSELVGLRNVWFTVFVIMLLGGITKTDQTDKMIWLTMGISAFFNRQWKLNKILKIKEQNKPVI